MSLPLCSQEAAARLPAVPHEVYVPPGQFVDLNEEVPSWRGCQCPSAQCCVAPWKYCFHVLIVMVTVHV